MKYLILFLLIFFANIALSQQYKELRNTYNYKDYKYQYGDPHHPALIGFVSYMMPGLGQIAVGETKRGLAFTGSYMGLGLFSSIVFMSNIDSNGNVTPEGYTIFYSTMLGLVCIQILSCIDAVRVTKVKNMAYRNNINFRTQIQISPKIEYNNLTHASGMRNVIGLNLQYSF